MSAVMSSNATAWSTMTLRHKLLDTIPVVREMEDGVLYISLKYAIVSHRCCCGCGQEVVTPISPSDWRLTFHGKTFSLFPSIGNWSFPCRSHYFIRESMVLWEPNFSKNDFLSWQFQDELAKSGLERQRVHDNKKKCLLFDVLRRLLSYRHK